MSPKEKAKELYEKYEFVYIQNYASKHEVKQCVLIAIDEILQSHQDWSTEQDEYADYWQQVKYEVERL